MLLCPVGWVSMQGVLNQVDSEHVGLGWRSPLLPAYMTALMPTSCFMFLPFPPPSSFCLFHPSPCLPSYSFASHSSPLLPFCCLLSLSTLLSSFPSLPSPPLPVSHSPSPLTPLQNLLDTRLSGVPLDHSETLVDSVKVVTALAEAIAMETMRVRAYVPVSGLCHSGVTSWSICAHAHVHTRARHAHTRAHTDTHTHTHTHPCTHTHTHTHTQDVICLGSIVTASVVINHLHHDLVLQ